MKKCTEVGIEVQAIICGTRSSETCAEGRAYNAMAMLPEVDSMIFNAKPKYHFKTQAVDFAGPRASTFRTVEDYETEVATRMQNNVPRPVLRNGDTKLCCRSYGLPDVAAYGP